jgi:hypothetical protein
MDRLPHAENSVANDDPFARVLFWRSAWLLPHPSSIGHVIDNQWEQQQRKRTLVLVCPVRSGSLMR